MSKRKRYLVTGIHPVLGRQPGWEFDAYIPPEQEKLLVQGGALKELVPKKVETPRETSKYKGPAASGPR